MGRRPAFLRGGLRAEKQSTSSGSPRFRRSRRLQSAQRGTGERAQLAIPLAGGREVGGEIQLQSPKV